MANDAKRVVDSDQVWQDEMLDQQRVDEEEAMLSELNDWANALLIEKYPFYNGSSFPMVECSGGCRDSVLPYDVYLKQLKKPDAKWKCPKCRRDAWWAGIGGFE